ncbi:MAG: nitrate/nitrite transporter NrtS [Spirochaetota bacterium]
MIKFLNSLTDRRIAPKALRVALIVGTLLFAINHGLALWQGNMDAGRWISSALSYVVPYLVNIQGRTSSS